MAKKKINSYVFRPGISFNGSFAPNAYTSVQNNKDFLKKEAAGYINRRVAVDTPLNFFPNAVRLLTDNKNFLINEISAYIAEQVDLGAPPFVGYTYDNAKCLRDSGYIVDALIHDIRYGGNEDIRTVVANYWINDIPQIDGNRLAEVAAYTFLKDLVVNYVLPGTAATPKQDPIVYAQSIISPFAEFYTDTKAGELIDIAIDVIENGLSAIPPIEYKAATFENYTYNSSKCERDLGYVLDAYLHDLRYDGNEQTRIVVSKYYDQDTLQVDGSGQAEVETHRFIRTRINDNIITNILGTEEYPEAVRLLTANKSFLQNEVTAYIAEQVSLGIPPFVGYTFNANKCIRDAGYIIDSYIYDLRFGGNEETVQTVTKYFVDGIAQVDGSRLAEVAAHTFLKDLIVTYVLPRIAATAKQNPVSFPQNTVAPSSEAGALLRITELANIVISVIDDGLIAIPELKFRAAPYQSLASQVVDSTLQPETYAFDKFEELSEILFDVILGGLAALPAEQPASYGKIKFQGRADSTDLLLITNTTSNQIIYNFTNLETGGEVTISDEPDSDFVTFLQTSDGITTIHLYANTSAMSVDDSIQIFIETPELAVRPYDFGTDAIERMRVAQPQAMLDADFEYGLQPTKWQAIATLRGYPSIFEIPGTELDVVTVVTDASVGTEGVGGSLITVTSAAPHGFIIGTPITVRGLNPAIPGARAEGSFVVVSIPTNRSFTYYAKAKTGSINGEQIQTTYTQVRQGGFYTGAEVGIPTFSVLSNGSSGSFTTDFIAPISTNRLAFTGSAPEIGAPITGTGINPGTQITAVVGSGGVVTTPVVIGDYSVGQSSITLQNTSGVVAGLALNSGNGTVTAITSITDLDINLTRPLTASIKGNIATYPSVTGSSLTGQGTGAVLSVTKDNTTTYAGSTVTSNGNGYAVGDSLRVLGSSLGGTSPANDLIVTVATIRSDTVLVADDYALIGGFGTGATVDVSRNNVTGEYTVTIVSGGLDYQPTDIFTIPGTVLGGASPTNDIVLSSVTVSAPAGAITNFTRTGLGISGLLATVDITSGVANPVADQTVTNINSSIYTATTAAGTGAVFSITRAGTVYTPIISTAGDNYAAADSFAIPGTAFTNGASPANNITLTVSTVVKSYTGVVQSSTSGAGAGATFNVTRNGSVFSATLTDPGVGYLGSNTITVLGNVLGGVDSTNDLTITVNTVGSIGEILTFSISGTAGGLGGVATTSISGTGNNVIGYTGLSATNVAAPGANATFTITRSLGSYTSVIVSTGGINYRPGNRISIPGATLGGTTLTHDLILTVNSVGLVDGEILSVTPSPSAIATSGVDLELYSAITIGEVTTALVPDNTTITYTSLASIRIDFAAPHGILPGSSFIVTPTSDNGVNNHVIAGGSYSATSVPTELSLTYQARAPGTISGTITGKVYARPDSFFTHRPFDGGVQLGTGGPQHGAQAIRQSKKYIRYQSGKGAMYTTGALFAPSYDIQYIESTGIEVGSTITITLDENDHGLQAGADIRLTGVSTAGYNGDYVVDEIITERVFTIVSTRRLGSRIPILDFSCQVSTLRWQGAVVRAGVFDDQNGIFWEYDGNELAVVQRTSTRQLAGTISINPGSTVVTGTNTRFRDQVKSGDAVVIRGMTHVITKVNSQTSMNVAPDFRGVNPVVGAKICLVFDKRVPQSQFNLDKLDGTGASGYDLDITKMQMIGIQFSWYGAGFIDFMLRGANGNFVFAHRMRNSNINTEAYMRTGNLPVRYEVSNYGATARLMSSVTNTSTTLMLDDALAFPSSGIVYVDNELIAYSGKTATSLTGCTRNATLTNFQSGATRSYTAGIADSHDERTGVILVSNTCTPLISHWGSAFLIDGLFDDDRGYIFSYTSTGNSITTTKRTVFLIRLAPSVSNAVVGDLGDRELLNRAQLLLKQISITSDSGSGGLVIEGVLNPQNYPANPGDISWGRLSGLAQGGQPSFAQIAPGGSVNWNGGATATTTTATTLATLSGSVTVPTGAAFNRPTGTTIFYTTRSSWDTLGADIGQVIADAKFPSGTTVTARSDSPTPTAITLPTINSNCQVPNNSGYRRPSGNNVLFIRRDSWESMAGSTTVTDIVVNDFRYPAGTTVLAVTGPFSFAGFQYYTITLSQNSNQNIFENDVIGFRFAGERTAGSTKFWFTQTSWSALPVDIVGGQTTNDAKFTGGTSIASVSGLRSFGGQGYFEVNFNQGSTSFTSAGGTVTFNTTLYYTITVNRGSTSAVNGAATVTMSLPAPASTTSFLYFSRSSWEASNAAANTEVAPTDVKFPSNTRVLTVSPLRTFAGTQYYQVTFTQSSTTVIAGSSTVTFQFGQPAFALPGETVFSFITNPGATDSLVLDELKELTTTSLGGRGTFPNGPDVLAINVYKVAGAAVNANIILRWSEAQA